MKTIANQISPAANKNLVYAVHLASAFFVVVCVAHSAMPVAALGLIPPCIIGFTCYRLWRRYPQHGEILLELYDFELLLLAPGVAVAGAVTALSGLT